MTTRLLLAAALLAAAATASAPKPPRPDGAARIRIAGSRGPLPGVLVTLTLGGKTMDTDATDSQGYYRLRAPLEYVKDEEGFIVGPPPARWYRITPRKAGWVFVPAARLVQIPPGPPLTDGPLDFVGRRAPVGRAGRR